MVGADVIDHAASCSEGLAAGWTKVLDVAVLVLVSEVPMKTGGRRQLLSTNSAEATIFSLYHVGLPIT